MSLPKDATHSQMSNNVKISQKVATDFSNRLFIFDLVNITA